MMCWYKLPARCHEDAFVPGLKRATRLQQALARELHVTNPDGAYALIDRESDMNRDQIKGVAQQVKGKVNGQSHAATEGRFATGYRHGPEGVRRWKGKDQKAGPVTLIRRTGPCSFKSDQ
jgi:hypothetical protein